MKRIVAAVALSLFTNAAAWAQNDNGCVYVASTNCTSASGDPFAVSMTPSTLWPYVQLNQSMTVMASPTLGLSGLMVVAYTNEDCSTSGTNVYAIDTDPGTASTISSSWLISGAFSASGSGLTATFTPTGIGIATLVFNLAYNNASCCGGSNMVSVTNTFIVDPINDFLTVNLLDMDFGDYSTETGFAAAGMTATDYWNSCWYSPVANLKWVNATNSGAGMTIAGADSSWAWDPGDNMYGSYLFNYGTSMTVTVTNLPDGHYDIFVYAHGNQPTQNQYVDLTVGGYDYGTLATEDEGSGWTTADWQNWQQFVLFWDIFITQSSPVVITLNGGTGGYTCINGIQMSQLSGPTGPPVILTQPQNAAACPPNSPSFSVVATGQQPISYQWLFDGTNLPGATSSTLTLTNVESAAGIYTVVLTNAVGGPVTSTPVLLSLDVPAAQIAVNAVSTNSSGQTNLTALPSSFNSDLILQLAMPGSSASLFASPEGASSGDYLDFQTYPAFGLATNWCLTATPALPTNAAVSYQWFLNASPITAATNSSLYLALNNTNPTGVYQLQLSNGCGIQLSQPIVYQAAIAPTNSGPEFLPLRSPPLVQWSPGSQAADVGSQVNLTVQALFPELDGTYSWGNSFNGGYLLADLFLNVYGYWEWSISDYLAAPPFIPAIWWNQYRPYVVETNYETNGFSQSLFFYNDPAYFAMSGQTNTSALAMECLPFYYQWRTNGVPIAGASGWVSNVSESIYPSVVCGQNYAYVSNGTCGYNIANAQLTNAATYDLVVSNSYGAMISASIEVSVAGSADSWDGRSPEIGTQPQGGTTCAGEKFPLSAAVWGCTPLSYQWKQNGTGIPGATNSDYTAAAPGTTSSYSESYTVVVTNSYGSITSSVAVVSFTNCLGSPPQVIVQPQDQSTCPGSIVFFNIECSGSPPLSYQWFFNGQTVTNATNSSFVALSSAASAGTYAVSVTNMNGSVWASAALSVETLGCPPVILTHSPLNQSVCGESSVALSVEAVGSTPMYYQWSLNGTNLPGATNDYCSFIASFLTNSGTYVVTVTNAFGNASVASTLHVYSCWGADGAYLPTIAVGPSNQTVCGDDGAVFEVQVVGTPPFIYQWSFDGTNITGATNSSYTISNAAGFTGTYGVGISNGYGGTNASATLSMSSPTNAITLLSQPVSQTNQAGTNVSFSVVVSNNPCAQYFQWAKAGYGNLVRGAGNVTGGEGPVLTLSNVSSNDDGSYSVVVSTGLMSITSSVATLLVTYPSNSPPTISYINPIKCSVDNGGFQVPFTYVLQSSDARDYDSQPVSFEVQSATNGQLFINGSPFATSTAVSPNCMFNAQAILRWVPAVTAPNTGEPAFSVWAFDGYKTSTNAVTVTIIPLPQTYVYGWGEGDSLGNGSNYWDVVGRDYYPQLIPTRVSGLNKVVELKPGLAVAADGSLWEWSGYTGTGCYGANASVFNMGAASDSSTDGSNYIVSPIQVLATNFAGSVEPFTNIAHVASDPQHEHVFAIRTDGTLWSWGDVGVLGYPIDPGWNTFTTEGGDWQPRQIDGFVDTNGIPVSVLQATVTSSIIPDAALALCSDTSVWWWGMIHYYLYDGHDGLDGYYFLTNSSSTNSIYPVRQTAFDTGSPVVQLAAAGDFYLALKKDGTVWQFGLVADPTWYSNTWNGTASMSLPTFSSTPVLLTNIPTNIVAISGSEPFDGADMPNWLLLASNGQVYSLFLPPWAATNYNYATTLVDGLTNIVAVDTSFSLSLALDSSGHVWGWGEDIYCELGNYYTNLPGTPLNASYIYPPVLIDTINNAQSIAAGWNKAFALGSLVTGVPTGLATVPSNAAVTVNWNIYAGAASYNIYRSTNNGGPYGLMGGTTSHQWIDSGLSNSTTYYYVVTAISKSVETPYSIQVSGTPYSPPGIPSWNTNYATGTNMGVVAECRDIELFWQAASGGAVYDVYRAASSITNHFFEIAQTSYLTNVDSSVQPGTEYFYYVVAVNGAGAGIASSNTGPVQLDTIGCTPAPLITNAYASEDAVIRLTWLFTNVSTNVLDGFYLDFYLYGPENANKQPPSTNTYFDWDYIPLGNLTTPGDDGPNSFSYTFNNFSGTVPDLNFFFKVTAVVNGQLGLDSTIAGPVLDCADCSVSAPLEVFAVPGSNQVFLEWQAVTNAAVYDVEYTTNTNVTTITWTEATTNVQDTWFWHVNLTNGTTYYYEIVPQTIFDYTNDAYLAYVGGPASAIVSATPEASNGPQSNVVFTVDAEPYDSLVYVHWETLGNPPKYQSFVDRKFFSQPDSNYQTISTVGYGLAFYDTSVVNGDTYTYRVTAFDSNYNRFQATASATPSATGILTAIATAGNGYVSLNWNQISANSYVVKHAFQSGGSYTVIARPTGISFTDYPEQNGVSNYYVIEAATIFNATIDSPEVGAMPMATLATMPPQNFQAVSGAGRIALSWSSVPGAANYRLSQSLPPDYLIYSGPGNSFVFTVPADAGSGTQFSFDLVAVNALGMQSAAVSTTVVYTNLQPGDPGKLSLSIGSHTVQGTNDVITNAGPTNLVLTASLAATNGGGGLVYFYDNGNTIGSAVGPVAQITWYNVPGGIHLVSAQAVSTSVTGTGGVLGQAGFGSVTGNSVTFNSLGCTLYMNVAPPLTTYQTSATDLQLPAPGLPVALSRSYNSQITNAQGSLGIGWTTSWDSAGLQIANGNITLGWTEAGQDNIGDYYAAATTNHLVTITLPGGSTVYFGPTLTLPSDDDPFDLGAAMALTFAPYGVNQGSLNCTSGGATISAVYENLPEDYTEDDWNNSQFSFADRSGGPLNIDGYVFTTPSGTQYQFGLSNSIWNLTRIVDTNGNTLTYSYYGITNRVSGIRHSNGRVIDLNYTNTIAGALEIDVSDSTGMAGGSGDYPALKYFVATNGFGPFLTEVDKLTDRVGGGYERTTYSYGTNNDQNAALLTQVFDGRGVLVVSNQYSTNGILAVQCDALLRSSTTTYNSSTSVQQVSKSVGGVMQTNTVNYTAGGAVAQVLQAITNAGYTGTTYGYDVNGNLILQSDSYGNTQATSYDGLNRPFAQSDALGNSMSNQLDAAGQPTLTTDANGNSTTNTYDGQGNLTLVQDPTGTQTTSVIAPAMMNSDGSVAAGGLVASTAQQAPGTSFNVVTSYTYYHGNNGIAGPNSAGEVQSVTQQSSGGSAPASMTSYQYDANGNKTSETTIATVNGVAGMAITTQYEYDGENRLVATIDPLGRISKTAYDGAGHPYITTDVDGRSTTNTYDANGNLIETAYQDGTVSRMTYDELNHVLYTQDRAVPSSGTTTAPASLNVYDGAGRVICVERLSGVQLTKQTATGIITNSYCTTPIHQMTNTGAGTLASFTRSVYDLDGRVQYAMAANGAVTAYLYDADGRRTNVLVYSNYWVSLSNTTTNIYPSGGALSTQYVYDPNGNQIAMIDANGHETDYQYDSANRLVLTTYPLNAGDSVRHQTETVYDGLGNKTETIDEAGVVTFYTYDYRGLLTSVTLDSGWPGALTFSYAYDERGNLIKQTDANGNVTQFQYDVLARRMQRMLPNGMAEVTAYADVADPLNPSVNVEQTSVTDFRGKTIVTTEDLMSRTWTTLLPAVNPGEGPVLESNSYAASGQLAIATRWSNGVVVRAVTNDYDSLNRLSAKVCPEGQIDYTYTVDNRVLTVNANDKANNPVADLAYGYDYAGRLSSVTNLRDASPNLTTYWYDNVGNLAGSTMPEGYEHQYEYNAQNRLTNSSLSGIVALTVNYSYQLDATGARTNVAETSWSGWITNVAWEYDRNYGSGPAPARVHRLARETMTSSSVIGSVTLTATNQYDGGGNRLSRSVGGTWAGVTAVPVTNQLFAFDHRDLISSGTPPAGDNSNYDANGNTVVDQGVATQDRYDALNRLIGRGTNIQISYDANGNRVSKTVSGTTTYYLVDEMSPTGYAQVLAEYNSEIEVNHVWGLSLIEAEQVNYSDFGPIYYGYDGRGNVRFALNQDNDEYDDYDYDAYGNLTSESYPGNCYNNYRYEGYEWDPDLRMYYNHARYYNPNLGRFWTMDTVDGDEDDPLTLHKYLYCQADPVNMTDPSGHAGLFNFTDTFGNRAHAAIESVYQAEHPGAIVGPTTGVLGTRLKPDIFDGISRTFMEIKPLSLSGVAKGAFKIGLYSATFSAFNLGYSRGTWPNGVRSTHVGLDPIAYFNVQGIIFYTDMTDNLDDLATISTVALARQFIIQNSAFLARTLSGAMARIPVLAIGGGATDNARLGAMEGIATLDSLMGAP